MGRSYSPSPPPYSPRSPPYSPTSPAPYSPSSPYYSPSNPPSPLPYDPRAPYPEPMPKYNKYILGNCSGMYYNCKTEDGEVIYGWQVGNFDFIHNILIYENGFTLNGGSLRSFDDPLNHDFLDAIKNSKFPKELVPNDKNTKLHHVSIEVLFSDDPSSQ